MQVSEFIIQRLADYGIDTCFLVYGGAISDLVDALPGRMKYVVSIHEQGAVFMAEGYAQVSGKPGLVMVTSGPGGGNIVSGLQNCYYNSVPLIALAGQVSTKFMRPEGSRLRQLGFQETPIVDIVKPITKYAATLMKNEDTRYQMERILHYATERRPGPALLEIPNDIQKEKYTPEQQHGPYPLPCRYFDWQWSAMEFLRDLAKAKRPGILVGGGAFKGRAAILAFSEERNIPVFRTWNALDVVTDDHPCYAGTVGTYGGPGRNFGIQNTDLLLVLGCRLSGRITGAVPESFARNAKLYVVDVDAGLLDSAYQPRKADVNVLCDCEEFINALA